MSKKILGLDLGTNSIGWALVEIDHEKGIVKIMGLGARILPMDAGEVKKFKEGGKIDSTAAQRTDKRGARRLNARFLLRRDRLHLVLNLLDALPKHYKLEIDFTNKKGEKCGQFKENREPKLAYLPKQKDKKAEFLFMDSYEEMLDDIGSDIVFNNKGNKIPYDWTMYYLRQKALSKEISLEELAWVLLSYNQKRGYERMEVEDKSVKDGEFVDELDLRVKDVIPKVDKDGKQFYEVHLDSIDNLVYNEFSNEQMTFENDLKEVIKTSIVDVQGNIDHKKTEFTIVDIYTLKIKDVQYQKDEKKHNFTLTFQNGWKEIKQPNSFTFRYKKAVDKPFDYIVETVYDADGNIKTQQGKDRKLREPDFSDNSNDWTLLKKKTEKEALAFNIEKRYYNENGNAKNYISPRIYDILKNDAKSEERTKIIGGMFQVVDRDFYREELNQIIATQKQFHKTLEDKKIFEKCVETLYPRNKNHRESLLNNKDAFQHLLVEDVLLYQRPLKSKKSEIGDCKYEVRWKNNKNENGSLIETVDNETGEVIIEKEPVPVKVVSASHPYFQEFRIWDKLHNLRLIQLEKEVNGKKSTNQDITYDYFKGEKEYQELFDELNNRKSMNQDQFLSYCKKKFKIDCSKKDSNFVWNFPEDEEIKGNETRVSFSTRFKRCGFKQEEFDEFMTPEKEVHLWHYLYSVSYKERNANERKSATTFFNKYFDDFNIDEEVKGKIIKDFAGYPKFASRYCAYSEKALKKLIPQIRKGTQKNYPWEQEDWYVKWEKELELRKEEILKRKSIIDFSQKDIDWKKYADNDAPIPFPKGLFTTFKDFEKTEDFKNLNLTQASYLIYGRHSELAQAIQWKTPEDIRKHLHQELKQHSLNNPVAEKVLLEMMQVVADIWDYYGHGADKFFSKIHIELGRELKKNAKEKESLSKQMSGNRGQSKRLRQILEDFLANSDYNANPKNSDHFERLKIVEDGAEHTKNLAKDFFKMNEKLKENNISKDEIDKILKKPKIEKNDFEKYKLWIEQGYRSPYSGEMISLSNLFDGKKYNIDHIFPQASVTNDSLSNKVVCEREINKLKSNQTGREFINHPKERELFCSAHNKKIKIINDDDYVALVKTQFSGNKRFILLSKEIPKSFTNSQLNNARHIARKAMELLSHIVREDGEIEFRSKNVLPVTGAVTSKLKEAWRLDQVWRELVSPRFIRLNELTQSTLFGDWQTSKSGHKYFDCNLDDVLREKDESYDIKRIDHRHHALDALIVALCTEDHVNYINNINANSKSEDYGKQIEKYRSTLKRKIKFSVDAPTKEDPKNKDWYYMKPGEKRLENAEVFDRSTVLEMKYSFKEIDSFGNDFKKMILNALESALPSFKQPKSNIRKASNLYFSYKDESEKEKGKKSLTKQIDKTNKEFQSENKRNIAIKKKMHDENPYGTSKVNFEWVKIADSIGKRHLIIDEDIRLKIADAYALCDENIGKTKAHLKKDPIKDEFGSPILETCIKIENPKIVNTIRKSISEITEFKRLRKIVNLDLQMELLYHLFKYNTIEVPLTNAKKLIENAVEYEEFKSACNEDDQFNSVEEFINYLEQNEYKYKNTKYEDVNLFVDSVKDKIDVSDYAIKHNFNLAFNIEGIDELNTHRKISIKKVKLFEDGEGKHSLGNKIGNKHKMVKGANSLFVIDRNNKAKYTTIKLSEEIENYYKGNKINVEDSMNKFSLKAGDLVYVSPCGQPNVLDFKNIDLSRIYKFVKSSGSTADFIQCQIASVIYNFNEKNSKDKEAFKFLKTKSKTRMEYGKGKLFKNEVGFGSDQDKNQNMMDGKTQIKERCIKLKIDRLGNISKEN